MTNGVEKRQRIDYIDYVKALCIFLMVVAHWTHNEYLFRYIYSFHMPAFFLVSGMLHHPRPWRYTFLSFAFPICCISLLGGILQYCFLSLDTSNVTWQQLLAGVVHYRFDTRFNFFNGDWFIWTLVALRFLFGDVRHLSFLRKKNCYITLSILAVIYMVAEPFFFKGNATHILFTAERAIPCLPFFCMGMYLQDTNWKPETLPTYMVIICMIAAIVMPELNGTCDIYYNKYGHSYLFFLINALLSTLLIMYCMSKLPASNFIKSVSTGTLIIIGLNQTLGKMLNLWIPWSRHYVIPFLIMAICYPAIIYFDKHFPLILGKWRRPI